MDNIKNKPSDRVSYTDKVNLEMSGTVFSLRQGGEVRLNGAIISLPLQHFPTGVVITNAGTSHVVSNVKSCLIFHVDSLKFKYKKNYILKQVISLVEI